jgi:hypothetical protein
MAGINNAKKLTPTISSARTTHLFMRLLRVTSAAFHSGLKFVKQAHPELPAALGSVFLRTSLL